MLTPKKQKFRKAFRDRSQHRSLATSGHTVAFGTFALRAVEAGEISSRQIEAARRAMTRRVKRGGKIWIRVFPHLPVTAKSAEVPMGSGKGSVDRFVFRVLPGKIIFEMEGVDCETAKDAMRLAGHKLSVKTKFVEKIEI